MPRLQFLLVGYSDGYYSHFDTPAKLARQYIRCNFPDDLNSIPLSFVLNNPSITSIPIGMMSKDSIYRNINIEKETTAKTITEKVGNWCLKNCQIQD